MNMLKQFFSLKYAGYRRAKADCRKSVQCTAHVQGNTGGANPQLWLCFRWQECIDWRQPDERLLVLNWPEVGELRKDQYEKKIYTFIGQRRSKL